MSCRKSVLSRYFIKSVDSFVALSESVRDDIRLFDTKKPRTFSPHPLYDHFGELATREESLKHLGLDPAYRYILFFGLIRDYKGLDLLLRAYADSRLRELNVRLLVAGEFYGSSDKYFELEKQLGLEGLIVWKNEFVPSEEVRYCFGAADIIAQPYKTATQSGVSQMRRHITDSSRRLQTLRISLPATRLELPHVIWPWPVKRNLIAWTLSRRSRKSQSQSLTLRWLEHQAR